MSARAEAKALLDESGPMHYRDLAAKLIASGKVKSKGATFPQTLSATLARSTDDFERVAPGVYKAR